MSIKLALAKIQPRKLILIHTPTEIAKNLIEYCKNNLPIEEIIEVNEDPVELISSMSIHPIKLTEEF